MWTKIEEKILQINRATGIEVLLLPDGGFNINLTTAFIKNNNIVREITVAGIRSIKEISASISKGTPVALIINGKGILNKKITDGADTANSITSILPNSNPADFYYDIFSNKNINVISIIRRESVDAIILQLKQEGFKIISLSLGFSPVNNIIPFIKTDGPKIIESAVYKFYLNGGPEILDFSQKPEIIEKDINEEEYLISGEYIKPSGILPFAAAIELMAANLKTENRIKSETIDKEREDHRYFKYFKVASISLLLFLFTVLLASFLFYAHYSNLNRELSETNVINNQQRKKISRLIQKISIQEKFLTQTGWNTDSRLSYFADRIASLTPSEVLLTSLNIYPVKNNLAGEPSKLSFKKDTIQLIGKCVDPVIINQFMNALKLIPGFKDAIIKNYQYRKEDESGVFQMEITTK